MTAAPPSWKFVPLVPTEDQLIAGQEAWMCIDRLRPAMEDCVQARAVWDAMLAAAPESPNEPAHWPHESEWEPAYDLLDRYLRGAHVQEQTDSEHERAAFEAWIGAQPGTHNLYRFDHAADAFGGQYMAWGVQLAWQAWQHCAAETRAAAADTASALAAIAEYERERETLAALIRRLARMLRKAEPAGDYRRLSDQALDLLRRYGLEGSVLRKEDNDA